MSRAWHVARWGPLGWAETLVKAAAFVVAGAALAATIDRAHDVPDGAGAWVVAVALGLATLGLVAAIADRWVEREVVSAVFVIVNVVAHAAMVAVALARPAAAGWIVAFCALMAAGEVVKIVFLTTTGFTVRDLGRSTLVGLTSAYLALYLVALAAAATL